MPLPRPPEFQYDLALLPLPGGRPAQMYDADTERIIDAPKIAIQGGKIVAIGEDVRAELAQMTRYVQEQQIISPEIHDIHTHFHRGIVWSQNVDADRDFHAWGTGYAVDAGSAGIFNGKEFFESLREKRTRTHRKAFINIAPDGLTKPGGDTKIENFRHVDIDRTVGVARDYADVIVGVKVRIGEDECGDNWRNAMIAAITASEKIGKPLMVHVSNGPPPLEEILAMLRPGDIVTHCFHGKHPQDLFTILRDGKVLDAVLDAQHRGVIFDVGHGGGSFDWAVVTAAVARGFRPNTISSDFHDYSRHNARNQPEVMSKILHAGIEMRHVFAMATTNAARAIGRSPAEMPRIAVGSSANLAVIDILKSDQGGFPLTDGPSSPTQATTQYGSTFLQKAFLVTDGVAL